MLIFNFANNNKIGYSSQYVRIIRNIYGGRNFYSKFQKVILTLKITRTVAISQIQEMLVPYFEK